MYRQKISDKLNADNQISNGWQLLAVSSFDHITLLSDKQGEITEFVLHVTNNGDFEVKQTYGKTLNEADSHLINQHLNAIIRQLIFLCLCRLKGVWLKNHGKVFLVIKKKKRAIS